MKVSNVFGSNVFNNLISAPLWVRYRSGDKQREARKYVQRCSGVGFRKQVDTCDDPKGQQVDVGAAKHEFESLLFLDFDKTE